jgi:A/G-specific adenine glycosylase
MRRPDRGLLAGLFEPVNHVGSLSGSDVVHLLAEYGIDVQTIREILPLGEAKHIFTHVEWHMTGYRVVLSELPLGIAMVFPTTKEITEAYAVPSAFRYYMKKLVPEGGVSDGA